jgi:peptidoglycan hydrolase-like protein with peptidoglycan-binding domain
MIKLKSIMNKSRKRWLNEQRGDEHQKKLNVLFVGDDETNSDFSYARKILNSGIVTGDIVTDEDTSSNKLRRLITANISDNYDIVCIMDDARDGDMSVEQSISNLNDAYTEAKKFDAKLVVIANASGYEGESESTKVINKWITTVQTIADEVIDLKNVTSGAFFNKDGLLTSEVHTSIAKELLRIIVKFIKTIEVSVDSDTAENGYEWILTDLRKQSDARAVFRNLGYGEAKNLNWLATDQAWEEAEDNYSIIYKIQLQLANLKYGLGGRGATGDYNKDTERAVRSFQEKNNLPTTGHLDLRTVALLFDASAIAADYVEDVQTKEKAPVVPIDVDAEWEAITDKVIDKFEGGYWNHDITQPVEKICTNHPYVAMYKNSGETLFGLDRRAGKIDKLIPYGEQFFAIIDAEKERLGSEFCKVWTWGYRGGDKEAELKKLASKITYDLYQDLSKRYLSAAAQNAVNSSKRLLFHFAYAVWNGPGFFQGFARVVNQGVAAGKTIEELVDLSIDARNKRLGGTAWAKGNRVVVDTIKNDPDLE